MRHKKSTNRKEQGSSAKRVDHEDGRRAKDQLDRSESERGVKSLSGGISTLDENGRRVEGDD